jgi:ATP-binding cassette, subfamily C (CFTR/MRP), member 1
LNIYCNLYIGVWAEKDREEQKESKYFNFFWILVISFTLASILRTASIYFSNILSSRNIHRQAIWKIIRAPSVFFDANPIGRILTRFSKDTVTLDYFIGLIFNVVAFTAFKIIGIVILI